MTFWKYGKTYKLEQIELMSVTDPSATATFFLKKVSCKNEN